MPHERLLTLAAADQRGVVGTHQAEREKLVFRNIILDLVSTAFTLIGLVFALVVLPEGRTQSTMAALFTLLTILWLATGPLRWKE